MSERELILQRIEATDTTTLRRLVRFLADRTGGADSGPIYLNYLGRVADQDVVSLIAAEKSYGNSWKQRGGVDTFHMLKRKWERIENQVRAERPDASPYDIFEHLAVDLDAGGLIDDVRDLRRYLILVEAEIAARAGGADSGRGYLGRLEAIAGRDIETIEVKERSYGSSWKRSGGIGAFMMFARKWDRIVQRVAISIEAKGGIPAAARENILEHVMADRRVEPILEDIAGLRQYLLLVEAEMTARSAIKPSI